MVTVPLTSVFTLLSGLLVEGRLVLSRHCMMFGTVDQVIMLASTRLRLFDERMKSLVARWRADKLVQRKPPVSPKKRTRPEPDEAAEKPLRLPKGFGWLSKRIRPDGFATADALAALIADPEMMALIEAAPQAVRLWRPVCQMYGIKIDAIPPLKRKPRPPTDAEMAAKALAAEARARARAHRDLSKTSSKKSVVPPGRTFPTNERDWAIWIRRDKRARKRWRKAKTG